MCVRRGLCNNQLILSTCVCGCKRRCSDMTVPSLTQSQRSRKHSFMIRAPSIILRITKRVTGWALLSRVRRRGKTYYANGLICKLLAAQLKDLITHKRCESCSLRDEGGVAVNSVKGLLYAVKTRRRYTHARSVSYPCVPPVLYVFRSAAVNDGESER